MAVMAYRTIARLATHIEKAGCVSSAGIPALVTLLRGIAEAALEHSPEGPVFIEELCEDERDAVIFARAELGEPRAGEVQA